MGGPRQRGGFCRPGRRARMRRAGGPFEGWAWRRRGGLLPSHVGGGRCIAGRAPLGGRARARASVPCSASASVIEGGRIMGGRLGAVRLTSPCGGAGCGGRGGRAASRAAHVGRRARAGAWAVRAGWAAGRWRWRGCWCVLPLDRTEGYSPGGWWVLCVVSGVGHGKEWWSVRGAGGCVLGGWWGAWWWGTCGVGARRDAGGGWVVVEWRW